MKTHKKYYYFFLLIFLSFSDLYSQTYIEKTGPEKVLEGEELNPFTLFDLDIISSTNPRNAEINGNSVSLVQIGEMNEVYLRTRTEASEINLLQNGNSNKTELDYLARTAIADLVQNGSYNTIIDKVFAPQEDISLELQQQGNDKYFERNGVNNLTKSLKFIQTDATPSLIINSFN
ncbi:MAG: hypothetical protein WBL21_07300 [Salinimicrobium sp.]